MLVSVARCLDALCFYLISLTAAGFYVCLVLELLLAVCAYFLVVDEVLFPLSCLATVIGFFTLRALAVGRDFDLKEVFSLVSFLG